MPCRAGKVLPSVGGLSTDRIRKPFTRTENVSRYFRMISIKNTRKLLTLKVYIKGISSFNMSDISKQQTSFSAMA